MLPIEVQCINEISVSGSFGEGVVCGCRVDLGAGESVAGGAAVCFDIVTADRYVPVFAAGPLCVLFFVVQFASAYHGSAFE